MQYLCNIFFGYLHPKQNDTWIVPLRPSTNLNHFYPVAGDEARQQVAAVRISLAECGSGAAGIRSTEYGYIRVCTTKKRIKNPLS